MSATKQRLVDAFLGALEAGRVVVAFDGGLLFDAEDGTAVEVVIDEARDSTLHTTFWTDDDNGDPVELATVRLHAGVIA